MAEEKENSGGRVPAALNALSVEPLMNARCPCPLCT